MIRLTLDLPESLHKILKSLATLKGETMRNIATIALEKYIKDTVKDKQKEQSKAFEVAKKLKSQFEQGKITEEEFKTKFDKIADLLEETEADEILMPYLLKMVNSIEKNKTKTHSWEEVKAKLKND